MFEHSSAHASVYQVLDSVLATGIAAPGSRGAISRVVDELRFTQGADEDLARAEAVAVQLHKLDWARQQNDEAAAELGLRNLKDLAVRWLDARICG